MIMNHDGESIFCP